MLSGQVASVLGCGPEIHFVGGEVESQEARHVCTQLEAESGPVHMLWAALEK